MIPISINHSFTMEEHDDLYSQLVSDSDPHYQWLINNYGKDFDPIQLAEQLFQNSTVSTEGAGQVSQVQQSEKSTVSTEEANQVSQTEGQQASQADTQPAEGKQEDKKVKSGMYCIVIVNE